MANITYEQVRALLGQRVKAFLTYEDNNGTATVAVGTLIGFGQGGEFEILEDDGFVHYCWPPLDIERDHPDDV